MRIALGTAQFGLAYGVANTHGIISPNEITAILELAASRGIDTLDTAIAYGLSEQRLGEAGVGAWSIVSKLPSIPVEITDVAEWLQNSIQNSLMKMQIPKLKGLLLHQPSDLLGVHGKILYNGLVNLKESGLVEKIGISIYSTEELDSLCQLYKFDIVQAPFNFFDRRLAMSGWLKRLHRSGIEIHTRSAFLQGLLLMKPTERPEKFVRWQSLWAQWDKWLAEKSISPLQACLAFVMSHAEISRVVVGIDSLAHLKEILLYASCSDCIFPTNLICSDENLINPSSWSKL